MGAPSTFEQTTADLICQRLAEGESLRTISRSPGMPAMATVFRWLRDDRYHGFRDQYARAREAQADALFEEIQDIADDSRNDWVERLSSDGLPEGYRLNGDHVRRSQLRIDVRKWRAGKLKPKVYGDKVALEHTSAQPDPSSMSREEIIAELQDLAARGVPIPPALLLLPASDPADNS